MICPKCDHEQPDGMLECQLCGVIFSKIHSSAEMPEADGDAFSREEAASLEGPTSILGLLKDRITVVDSGENSVIVAGRAFVYLMLLVWGFRLMTSSIASNFVGESFLHLVNLPFHEAGHILFAPFGRFIQVLGGTLGQWLAPFAVFCAFLAKGNPFGASVGLWWLGESFLDIAPYMNDARAGRLMLLGGVTGREVEDYHDWEVILKKLGMLQYDHLIARTSFAVGVVFMLLSLAWGGYILRRQYKSIRCKSLPF